MVTSRLRQRRANDYLREVRKWMGRLVYFGIAMVLIIFGGIHIVAGFWPELATGEGPLPSALRDALLQAEGENVGDRGDYFNFLIGVPLAAAGSAIAAIVAASARSVAERQQTIQEMDLIDRKLTKGSDNLLSMVNALDDIHQRGSIFLDDLKACFDETLEEKVALVAVLTDERVEFDGVYEVEGPRVEAMSKKWRGRMQKHIEIVQAAVERLFDDFQELTFDPFWARTFDTQTEFLVKDWAELTDHLRQQVKAPLGMGKASPRRYARLLRKWLLSCDLSKAITAWLYLPDDACPTEFVGATIRLLDEEGGYPRETVLRAWQEKQEQPVRMFNLGGAILYCLYRSLPSQEAIQRTVFDIFPKLDTYEARGYFASVPNKRQVTDDSLEDSVDDAFKAPDRLVYLQHVRGDAIYRRPERAAYGPEKKTRQRPQNDRRMGIMRRTTAAGESATPLDDLQLRLKLGVIDQAAHRRDDAFVRSRESA